LFFFTPKKKFFCRNKQQKSTNPVIREPLALSYLFLFPRLRNMGQIFGHAILTQKGLIQWNKNRKYWDGCLLRLQYEQGLARPTLVEVFRLVLDICFFTFLKRGVFPKSCCP
jgi:hypothetical protein